MLIPDFFLFRNAGRARPVWGDPCDDVNLRDLLCVAISPQLRKRAGCLFGPACVYRSTGTVRLGPALPRIQGGTIQGQKSLFVLGSNFVFRPSVRDH